MAKWAHQFGFASSAFLPMQSVLPKARDSTKATLTLFVELSEQWSDYPDMILGFHTANMAAQALSPLLAPPPHQNI